MKLCGKSGKLNGATEGCKLTSGKIIVFKKSSTDGERAGRIQKNQIPSEELLSIPRKTVHQSINPVHQNKACVGSREYYSPKRLPVDLRYPSLFTLRNNVGPKLPSRDRASVYSAVKGLPAAHGLIWGFLSEECDGADGHFP